MSPSCCGAQQLLHGRWQRWQRLNASATPPLLYTLQHRSGERLRKHRLQQRGNASYPQFPEHLMWQWLPVEECPLPLATHHGFCSALQALQIRRIFVVGDSMQYAMFQSLWNLLAPDPSRRPGDPIHPSTRRSGKNVRSVFQCGSSGKGKYVLAVRFVLNNRLSNCTASAYETGYIAWAREYVNSDAPTLLLASMGSHVHSVSDFEESMSSFMRSVAGSNRTQDVVVFRTTTPGQVNCEQFQQPLGRVRDFQLQAGRSANLSYSWDLHPSFNSIAAAHVRRAARGYKTLFTSRIGILDVYPMSVTRPDARRKPPEDCLHYTLPGVPDFWNHLLLVKLQLWAKACT